MGGRVALLRAVNVGGANRLAMADLRIVAENLGYLAAKTLLQTGNLVIEPPTEEPVATTEARLQAALVAHLALNVDVIARTAAEWSATMTANPFEEEARHDSARLVIMALKADAAPGGEARLIGTIRGPEQARLRGRDVFIHYPDGMGASRLTAAVVERALGVRGTARNWNTVQKIAALLAD